MKNFVISISCIAIMYAIAIAIAYLFAYLGVEEGKENTKGSHIPEYINQK